MVSKIPSLFIFTIFLLTLMVSVSAISIRKPGKYGAPAGTTDKGLKEMVIFEAEDDSSKLNRNTARYPGRYMRGVFLLCEGYTPTPFSYASYTNRVKYTISYGSQCTVVPVYGSFKSTRRYLNHASLWSGAFTGLDALREWAIVCPDHGSNYVSVTTTINGRSSTVAKCTDAYEAHVFGYSI